MTREAWERFADFDLLLLDFRYSGRDLAEKYQEWRVGLDVSGSRFEGYALRTLLLCTGEIIPDARLICHQVSTSDFA